MTKTYYTYRIRVANRDRVQVEKWDARHQNVGQPSGIFRYQEKRETMIPLLEIASQHAALNDSSKVRVLGEALFDVLFDEVLRQDFVNVYYDVVQKDKQLLRVELDIDEREMPDVAALPWEFTCLPGNANLGQIWMGTDPNLIFARRRSQWRSAPEIQLNPGEKLRIALAISAPTNLGSVVSEKVQVQLEKLAKSLSNRIELLPIINPATSEAIDALLEQEPHIFHFIGHGRFHNESGEDVGQIALVDDAFDEASWVDASIFGELLNRHRPGVVLLQACEGGMLSASQAFVGVASKIVQQNIPVVVAMQYEVSNVTASRFAYRFYERLAQDDPVDIAAQNGRRAIALNTQYSKRDFATPIIFMGVTDGYLFKRPGVRPNLTSGSEQQSSVKETKDLNLSDIKVLADILEIRYLENKLNLASYKPSQPTAKPGYFADNPVFKLIPLDIGTIWGLQRSSFIGLLIGFEQTEIYENLKNVEFVLSQSIEEVNSQVNASATILLKREWIRLDINKRPGVPCQKFDLIDAVVDLSNEVSSCLKNNSFPDLSIPGFFFEVDSKLLYLHGYEKIKIWCNALLNQLFSSHSVAVIISIITSLDEFLYGDVEGKAKKLKDQLRTVSKEIPIDLIRLDTSLFFDNNKLPLKNEPTNFINIERKPGLPFCSWMYNALTCNFKNEKLSRNKTKYINVIDLYRDFKEKYSVEELQDTYSVITAQDVVLDIQSIAPTMLEKAYEGWLQFILNVCPQWIYKWIGVYAESAIEEAVHAALIIATNADLLSDLSDILIEAWVEGISFKRLNINLLYKEVVFAQNCDSISNQKLEGLFIGLLRKEKSESDRTIQTILQEVIYRFPDLKNLYHFCQNQENKENGFLLQNDPNQFALAVRAKVKFEQAINQLKKAPVSHLPIAICWLLAAMPPSQKNITELLQLDPKKRAVFGICTHQEWLQIKRRQNKELEVLDCRRERSLIFTPTHL